jgi:hypothetical protein
VQDSFDEDGNGWGLWQLTQNLTPSSKLNLCVALINQIVCGGWEMNTDEIKASMQQQLEALGYPLIRLVMLPMY